MKRFLSYVLCLVLTVIACIYLPPAESVQPVSAAVYTSCRHHNFARTATDKILVCQPMAAKESYLTAVADNAGSGFEAGSGLTINGTTYNSTASIAVSDHGVLKKLAYSTATTAEKAILDTWGANRGVDVAATYMIQGNGIATTGWGYDITITWTTPIDFSVLSHFYMQFWIVNMGGLSHASSALQNTSGHFWFNLIGDDSTHSLDGWNFPVYVNQLTPDSDGYVNTAHYYSFPISGAHGKYGTLKSVKKMVIRYNSAGNGATTSPTIILGKFMTEVPVDNVQTSMAFSGGSGANYTNTTTPDANQTGVLRMVGSDTANSVCGVRYPMYVENKSTFVIGLRYGNYAFDVPYFWAWRYKSERTPGTISVQSSGGAYGSHMSRGNAKYINDTKHYKYTQ